MPETDDPLADAFLVSGLTTQGPMGELPLDWLNIWAFGQATGRISDPWEHEVLAEMSRDYLAERQEGESPFRIPPVERGD